VSGPERRAEKHIPYFELAVEPQIFARLRAVGPRLRAPAAGEGCDAHPQPGRRAHLQRAVRVLAQEAGPDSLLALISLLSQLCSLLCPLSSLLSLPSLLSHLSHIILSSLSSPLSPPLSFLTVCSWVYPYTLVASSTSSASLCTCTYLPLSYLQRDLV